MKSGIAASLFMTVSIISVVRGEIPNMSKDKLQAKATHIVTGAVKLIAAEEVNDGSFLHKVGVVEIRVNKVEKGEQIDSGDAVYARFWTQTWVGKGQPPTFGSGHRLPKKGDTVRAYLEKREGGYDALLPNAFELIPTADAPHAK